MGVVYLAEDTKLERKVALKFLPSHATTDNEAVGRFEREAKAAAALNHPNIITIHEISDYEGQTFIVTEYVEGESLREKISDSSLPIEDVINIAGQISEGLSKAHQAGIVHRDMKPENILVNKDGRVKIVDFGLAKLKGAGKLTKDKSTLGTIHYMSPEQTRGKEVDNRTDIWSVGVVLHEMITGQCPFKGEYEQAVIYSILNEEPEPVTGLRTGVSVELERIVKKSLAKRPAERYQHIENLLSDLRRERGSPETDQISRPGPDGVTIRPGKKFPLLFISVGIVFLLAFLFFILRPFRVAIAPQRPAIAAENPLAIMYFENMVDPEDRDRFSQMITALLITDLSESRYLRVVSRQRLFDILKLLGKENLKEINRTVASEVAKRAGVKWILTGSILQTEPNIVLTSDISDASSGEILATQRVTGEAGENLFKVVDKLSVEVRQDFSLPEGAKQELDRPVADFTSHSLQAYRYYLEGLDFYNKVYDAEAEESFRKTLEFDSTFAMAYYWLTSLTRGSEQEKMRAKAVQYMDGVTQKEKLYIQSDGAYLSGNWAQYADELHKIVERYPEEKRALFWLGNVYIVKLGQPEKGIEYIEKVIELDPLNKLAYNKLAYVYNAIGDFDKSMWAINQYISLAPDEPNPYDTRGDLYAFNGKINQAVESYKKTLKIKPDFLSTMEKLGHMYLFKREYAEAESCYQELTSSDEKETRSKGRTFLAYIPLHQGKFKEALEMLDNSIAADRMEKAQGWPNAYKYLLKAAIFEQTNDLNLARREAEIAVNIHTKGYQEEVVTLPYTPIHDLVRILVQSGKVKDAEEIAHTLKRDIGERNPSVLYIYWSVSGIIELSKGDEEIAINYLEKSNEEAISPLFHVRFFLAKAYLESERLGETVDILESMLSRYDESRALYPILAVKSHYLLGSAYEKSGWNMKAVKQYEEFLDIWKNADPGIVEMEDAKERVAKLKGISVN